MANDRIGALEVLVHSRAEARDKQLGDLAAEISGHSSDLAAIAHRLEVLEGVKQPTALTFWGPAVATLALVGAVGGAFLTMVQREQEAQYEVVASRYRANVDKIDALRVDMRFLDSQIRIQDRDFRGVLSSVEARQQMLEKQIDDFRRSRAWGGKE